MNSAKIVIHEIERDGGLHVVDLHAEPVGEPRESTHRHRYGQVLALQIARQNKGRIGIVSNGVPFGCNPAGRPDSIAFN